ncbi:hypothetical protein L4D09_15170 [Photobacterium makurazakiensis]
MRLFFKFAKVASYVSFILLIVCLCIFLAIAGAKLIEKTGGGHAYSNQSDRLSQPDVVKPVEFDAINSLQPEVKEIVKVESVYLTIKLEQTSQQIVNTGSLLHQHIQDISKSIIDEICEHPINTRLDNYKIKRTYQVKASDDIALFEFNIDYC